ncbi:MAG: hypothetical protein A2Y75_01605 [Candidatus Solincola sediminis]|uniref:Uncharacterized protein n=1 Tax=Candidatus Solincola sediminis TaxID=1797199 RepID=A0A1F2WNL1_9ACTN|nr:MAG: hypothetical protein A2Y75_01605 [Candidatus Solincola sediminis]
MVTSYVTANHDGWYHDCDGVLTNTKHHDEQSTYTFDLIGLLGADTISGTPVWKMLGPTKVSQSNTTTTITVTITGSGDAEVTVTTAAGQTHVLERRWKSAHRRHEAYR